MLPIDTYRFKVMRHLASLGSVQGALGSWLPTIMRLVGETPTGQSLFDLGDHLAEIFKSNVSASRDQSGTAAAGKAWEVLVAWYLNMAFFGTNTLVLVPIQLFIPAAVQDALAVTISNHQQNSESDLVAISASDWAISDDPTATDLDRAIRRSTADVSLGVIQCKTNWNENAQIPMLWDFIYTNSFRGTSVGRNGLNPEVFRRFTYSFVTVPTVKRVPRPNTTPVNRVAGLSGGNYWGHPTLAGVARSLKEYSFTNFSEGFVDSNRQSISVTDSIERNLIADQRSLRAFSEFNF